MSTRALNKQNESMNLDFCQTQEPDISRLFQTA